MKIDLDLLTIKDIKDALFDSGYEKTFERFSKAVKQSSQEINYENFGSEALNFSKKVPKLPSRWTYLARTPINKNRKIYRNTNLNYLDLKRDENGRFLPKYRIIASFSYPHGQIKIWRKVQVENLSKNYIEGYDKGTYKKFRKDRIIGAVSYKRIKI